MSKLVSTVSALKQTALQSCHSLHGLNSESLSQAVADYVDDFNEKVENDTLSFKEALAVFLGGMALCTVLIALASWIG